MRLGLFNGDPKHHLYGQISPSQVCTKKNKDLAVEAARQGIVLLKNSANLLPLSQSKISSLGIIGPNANSVMLGNYAGPPCTSISPLQALQSYVKDARFVQGCNDVACASGSIGQAVELAESVDQVVLIMGLDLTQEKEELDRTNLVLPGMQQNLISSVAKTAKRPVILVLLCGGPVDVSFAKNDMRVGGILWAGYPGEAGGLAIAEVLFGQHNPGGRLPVTWYPQEFTSVPMTDMRMRPDPSTGYPGRTYRFYTGTPVFKFGYGLSYSTHSYEFTSATPTSLYMNNTINLQTVNNPEKRSISYDITNVEAENCNQLQFSVSVRVRNHGPMAGRHSVLLFLRRAGVHGGRPIKQLIGFKSLHLESGENVEVQFGLEPCYMVPTRIHECANDRHEDETRPFLWISGSNLPVLHRHTRVHIWLWPELLYPLLQIHICNSKSPTSLYMNKTISLQTVNNPGKRSVSCDISKEAENCNQLKFSTSVRVANHGHMAGRHSVLLFLRRSSVHGGRPIKQLIGFESWHLESEERLEVQFGLEPVTVLLFRKLAIMKPGSPFAAKA